MRIRMWKMINEGYGQQVKALRLFAIIDESSSII